MILFLFALATLILAIVVALCKASASQNTD